MMETAWKYKPYPEYKDSGIEWLGEIPAHWNSIRLKFTTKMKLQYGANEAADEENHSHPRFVRITDIDENGFLRDDTFRSLPPQIAEPYMLKEGDILFARSGATVGKTFRYDISWGPSCFAGYLILCRPDLQNYSSRFLYYFTKSGNYLAWRNGIFIQATIENISAEKYNNFLVSVPSLKEQQAIASFLDRETARIDELIAKKEQLIALLEEKRTALISHAVTKGLNPDAKMKDSGIEWLGKIPAHWDTTHLRCAIKKFVDYRGKTPEKVDHGIPLITAKNVKNGEIDLSLSEEYIKGSDYDDWMIRGLPEIGDVIVTTEAPLGEVAQIKDSEVALAQRIILLKAHKELFINEYIKYHFISLFCQAELYTRASGSTALGIRADRFKNTKILIPPIEEQESIVVYIEKEISCIRDLVKKNFEVIDKLQEYRTALISAAVTGKIDVRGQI